MSLPITTRHALPLLSAGQAQKEIAHNEALLIADFAMNPVVETIGETPPAEPGIGRAWIVGPEPVGLWAGRAGEVACWTAGGWRFLAPFEGLHAWRRDLSLWAMHDGSGWVTGVTRAAAFLVGGVQVVGERQGAIPTPTGGETVDEQARAGVSAILAALRAHGLISS